MKRKLYREENLTLTKLQETVNIFDEPDALLLTPFGTREEANTIYTKHSSGFNSPDRTFKEKCDAMTMAQQEIVENLKTTHVRNAAKLDTFRPVATPGNHKVAPLVVTWTDTVGEVVESRMENETLEWRRMIHSMYFR